MKLGIEMRWTRIIDQVQTLESVHLFTVGAILVDASMDESVNNRIRNSVELQFNLSDVTENSIICSEKSYMICTLSIFAITIQSLIVSLTLYNFIQWR